MTTPGHLPEEVTEKLTSIQKEMFAYFEAGDLFNALRLNEEYNAIFWKAYIAAKG